MPDGKTASRVSLSKQEAVFSLPTTIFHFDAKKPGFAKLRFTYMNPSGGFLGRTKRESTDIAVMELPKQLGEFSLQAKTRDTIRDLWSGEREFYWSGRDESRTEQQWPHDNGWSIVVSSVHQGRVWGKAGRGCHLLSNTPGGFAIDIRVGRISTLTDPNAPGYQHCIWHWQEFIDRTV